MEETPVVTVLVDVMLWSALLYLVVAIAREGFR